MENSIAEQVYSLLIYVCSGIIIGILFDIFRVLRKTFNTTDLITYIEDLLFWLITGIFIIFVLFKISNGQIRIYNIIGLLLGTIAYILLISKIFINISVKILTFIKKLIYKLLIIPTKFIIKLFKSIFKPFTFFVINIKKYTFNFKNIIKNKKCKKRSEKRRILY